MTREEEAAKDKERHLRNREERIKRMRENYHEKRWRSKVDRGIEIWKLKMRRYLKNSW